MRKTGYAYHIDKQKALIKQSVKVQLVAISILFILMLFAFNCELAVSSLIGGICAIIPNISFALYCFKYRGAQSAKKIISSFYLAEMLKFILVFWFLIISYGLAGSVQWLKPIGILIGFIATYISVIFVMQVTKK
jgi:ATP synthase protein I